MNEMYRKIEADARLKGRVKLIGTLSMLVVGGISIFYAIESTAWRLAGGALLLTGLVTVASIKTCPGKPAPEKDS